MIARAHLPNRRGSVVVAFEHEGQRYRASASRFPDGRMAEIFLDVGKAGSSVQRHADDAAVLASLLLQHGVPVSQIRHSVSGPIATAIDMLVQS
jgi:hypothetical protein